MRDQDGDETGAPLTRKLTWVAEWVLDSVTVQEVPNTTSVATVAVSPLFRSTGELGVPLWQNNRANTVPVTQDGDSRAKLLYRISEVECYDGCITETKAVGG